MITDAEADAYLIRWGNYVRNARDHGVGYPNETIEGRASREGGFLRTGDGTRPLPEDTDAERVERIMLQMQSTYPTLYRAAHLYYVTGLTMDKVGEKMSTAGVTVRLNYLPRVRHLVAGALTNWDAA